jgi:hypothetical protein
VTLPATIIARACSPDERSDIRGGVRVVPNVALLIRATKAFPSLRAKRSNPSRRPTKAGLLRFARNDVESFESQSAKRPHSRGTMPELCDSLSPVRGRRECRVPASTRGLVCKVHLRSAHTSIQAQPEQPGIPCTVVLRLMPCSLRRRIHLASVAGELTVRIARLSFANLRRLDTSNGRQDRTVLPYAASSAKNFNQPSAGQLKIWRKRLSAVRLRAMFAHGSPPCEHIHAPDAAASTATRPNVRDDGRRPSSRDGMAGVLEVIWGRDEAEYFCERDWTGQIALKLL